MLLIMAQRIVGRAVSGTVALTTAAARLLDLIQTQLGITVQDSFREVTLQPDPEGASDQVRVGDASLGTTVGGVVQKGVTLAGGDSLTETASSLNTVPAGSIFVQSVTGTPNVNFQLIPY